MDERVTSFREVVLGLTERQARAEAARCLQCGLCSECLECVRVCGVKAIDHNMTVRQETINVGAVILAPGYQTYAAELSEEFGFGRYPNVVTALQFERLLSASGPTMGHVFRPSDGKTPKKIAFLQCIGSRDTTHDYCSAVCCMYATKEAIIAKEHHRDLEVHVYLMDMRAFSKGYWSYFERARDRYGVQYHHCRVSEIQEEPETHGLVLHYAESDNRRGDGSANQRISEEFDLVVLSVGMEISEPVRNLGRRLGVELDEYGFCKTIPFKPLETTRPGIYAVGPFREPKDIPESVIEASGAAASAAAQLSPVRFSLTRRREYPLERNISGEQSRIGVFVCSCGSNIGGFLNVPEVAEYARTLPGVVHSEWNLYSCSQDSIQHITDQVKALSLNRVVVASCTPLTHGPLFQDSIRAAGLNPYLFEMANIRNHCSWVHSDDWEIATEKAKDLVRMAVARAGRLAPQQPVEVAVKRGALVVGGGIAGMTAALSLAEQGFPVHLVEKEAELGGNLRVVTALPSRANSQPLTLLHHLSSQIPSHPLITLHLQSQPIASSGFMGNFLTTLRHADGRRTEIQHGVTILATGGQEYRGAEYGYGTNPKIVTQRELEKRLGISESGNSHSSPSTNLPTLPSSVIMIQCVGPAEKYCSRICCTVALKNALRLKELNPNAEIVILYRDIRTYGFKEQLYSEARQRGVIFVCYDEWHHPQVTVGQDDLSLNVRAWDFSLQRWLAFQPELLVLSMPIVPSPEAHELARLFKVPIDSDGFFLEAHVKLRPVDFATDGVFMAGMAHYPKLVEESIIQAQAAAARAARVLSRETLTAGGRVAVVDPTKCTGCLTCVRICPFNVPKIKIEFSGVGDILGAAYIESAVCQGCGSCVAECPARAIQLMHYTDAQLIAKVSALFTSVKVRSLAAVS
jgi:heterodisulfide reductase subunit A-like polyferredoxin